jgi:hypothetical protein
MIEYVTVFRSTPPEYTWLGQLAPSILVGGSVMAMAAWLASQRQAPGLSRGQFFGGIALISISTLIALLCTPRPSPAVVEGIVADFQPMPYGGHASECFTAGSRRFCYSDYEFSPYFRNTASHGGPVRARLPVRVTHLGNSILRLEIAEGSVPSGASRAVAEALAKRQHEENIRTSPVDQGFTVGLMALSLVVTGLMSWRWKRAFRLWFPTSDYPLTPVLFRLFVGACFFGAAWRLLQHIREHPLTLQMMVPVLFLFGLFGAFAIYMFRRIEKFHRLGNK